MLGYLAVKLFAFIILNCRSNSGNSAAIGLTTKHNDILALVLAYSYPGQINVTKYLVGDIISASSLKISNYYFLFF